MPSGSVHRPGSRTRSGPGGSIAKSGGVYTFRSKDSNATVRLYTDLDCEEAAALHARTPLTDLYGNPFDAATWFPGTLLYAN